MSKKVSIASMVMLLVVGATWAQTGGSTVPLEPDLLGTFTPDAMYPAGTNAFGIEAFTAAVTAPNAFHAYNFGLGHRFWVGGYIGPQTGDTFRYFDAPVDLPTGAWLDSVKIFLYDNDAAGYVRVYLNREECTTGTECTHTELFNVATGTPDVPGYTILGDSGSVSGMTWTNFTQTANTVNYGYFRVYFSAGNSDLRVGPIWVWYRRQISPAPGVATFPDVGTGFWAFQEIEALASSGITTGFPDGTFKPTANVTRAQMATFLARALGLDYPDFAF